MVICLEFWLGGFSDAVLLNIHSAVASTVVMQAGTGSIITTIIILDLA